MMTSVTNNIWSSLIKLSILFFKNSQGNNSIGLTNFISNAEDSYEEMTMDEIFNGKETYYPGLIPLVYAYLDYINCDPETFHRIDQYLKFISR